MTLALEQRGLSEEARQTTAAREREQAAQACAAELTLTNEAMRRGSEAMASAGNDTAVMGALLTQATAATGAVGATVKRRTSPGASQMTLVAISQHGRVISSHVALALKMIRLFALARDAAVNEERNRLAGEIHDSLAHSFAGIAMQLESAEDAALHDEHLCVLNGLRRAREVARFGLADARRSVLALRPADALAGGLIGAFQSLVERLQMDKLMDCRLVTVGVPEGLGADAERQLFRVAQEAEGNAVRHGRPRLIMLTLTFAARRVCLRVHDDRGFADPAGTQWSALSGLRSIQRRAETLGGTCQIESFLGCGTTLRVAIPRRPATAATIT